MKQTLLILSLFVLIACQHDYTVLTPEQAALYAYKDTVAQLKRDIDSMKNLACEFGVYHDSLFHSKVYFYRSGESLKRTELQRSGQPLSQFGLQRIRPKYLVVEKGVNDRGKNKNLVDQMSDNGIITYLGPQRIRINSSGKLIDPDLINSSVDDIARSISYFEMMPGTIPGGMKGGGIEMGLFNEKAFVDTFPSRKKSSGYWAGSRTLPSGMTGNGIEGESLACWINLLGWDKDPGEVWWFVKIEKCYTAILTDSGRLKAVKKVCDTAGLNIGKNHFINLE